MKFIVALLLFIVQSFPLMAQYFDLRDANSKYLAGDYDAAKQRYDKIIAESEKFDDKKEAVFNSGNALYRMKKFSDAESDYRKIAENDALDPSLRADAFYNIGNGYFTRAKDAQGEEKEPLLKDAIKQYKESLKLNPNDLQAKQNLELAKAVLKQEEEKKQGNDKNDKQDNDKNDKNQNKDNKQDDKNNQDQKNNKDKQDNEQKQNQQNQNNQENQNKPKDQKQNEEQGKQGDAQISKADAEKLLDALKQDEKNMLKKYLMKKSNQTKYDKDW